MAVLELAAGAAGAGGVAGGAGPGGARAGGAWPAAVGAVAGTGAASGVRRRGRPAGRAGGTLLGDRLVDPGMDDRLAFLEPEAPQHRIHPLGAEDPHQIVFERDKEFRGAGIALAAGAAAQLIVDAPALVPLAADVAKVTSALYLSANGVYLGLWLRACTRWWRRPSLWPARGGY